MKQGWIIGVIIFCCTQIIRAQEGISNSAVVPTPRHIVSIGHSAAHFTQLSYHVDTQLDDRLMQVFKEELALLGPVPFTKATSDKTANIQVLLTDTLAAEAYAIRIDTGIQVCVGSNQALAYATTTLVQLVEAQQQGVDWPRVWIKDEPAYAYRGLMVDLGRQWHDVNTLKQVIKLCRFYKIPYLQLHLADDQLFTFQSNKFKNLVKGTHYYSKETLQQLVDYADSRGVTLIPELDLPGHSTAMRQAMPALFGPASLHVINIAQEATVQAAEALIAELADIFKSSPYFHIGGDETNLDALAALPETASVLRQKGFDDVHDLFLDFIVRMHRQVTRTGKKTLMWESFSGTGSQRVQIPKDIRVIAWETLYQRPDSLLRHGYSIINASWKPLYLTPRQRWSARQLYENWNPYKWANWWDKAPSFSPIQLEPNERVLGAQFCSWELSDYMEIPELCARLPFFSQQLWCGNADVPYRALSGMVEQKHNRLDRLLFPASLQVDGVEPSVYKDLVHTNHVFVDSVVLMARPLRTGDYLTYTTDGTVPQAKDQPLPERLSIQTDTDIKIALFDSNKQWIGYYHNAFKKVNCTFSITGPYRLPDDTNVQGDVFIQFQAPLTVHIQAPEDREVVCRKMQEDKQTDSLSSWKPVRVVQVDKPGMIEVKVAGDNEVYRLHVLPEK